MEHIWRNMKEQRVHQAGMTTMTWMKIHDGVAVQCHAYPFAGASLRDTIGRSYYEARGRYPDDFWRLKAGGGGSRNWLTRPNSCSQGRAPRADRSGQGSDVLEDWMADPSEDDLLFAPELPGGASCVYTQRVLQIASIVRSLSFHDENVQYLAKNTTLLRFLLLCANSWVGSLRQSGLDTLGNVSTELIIKDPATCLITRHVLSTIQAALVSQDRARVLAALELLNKLAQNELNEDALLKSLEAKAQSYGPRACILMRVVETVSGPSALQAQQPAQHAQHAQLAQHTPHAQTDQHDRSPQLHHTSQTPTKSEAGGTSASLAPVSTLQQSHLQQRTVQENEHFAQAWLRSAYEVLPASDNSACDANDLYRQYLACCTKLSRKGPQAQPTTSHPHLSQALESSPSNTTLIKHLLAHKVSPALQPQQKSAQNKMLADLLKKNLQPSTGKRRSNGPTQINAPTIQITETGQIVQVKSDPTPVIQINDSGLVAPGNQYFQIKNEQGQVIQIKNDQGQIIQLKSDQLQAPILQYKNEQGQLVQLKTEGQVQMKTEKEEPVPADHSYTEPPAKKTKVEEKAPPPQESVSKTAANLYAALAASALEDEEDLVQPPPLTVQQPYDASASAHIAGYSSLRCKSKLHLQQTIQVQQPMLQVQPMDVHRISLRRRLAKLSLQEKSISSQPTQYVQQPMQIIATPSNAQGGISYIAQNIPGNMMQKTIIIVQGPTGGGPLTLTVNNPGGLDEATLNSLITQATEAITQQQIIQVTFKSSS
ncbi:hypothetical protein HF086_003301 [Spodoptera exigua]|uniref:Uncharacterized protein n=1 Tax=Spodoptera exigua TaxID=7107 RepID=A0A922SPG2_SPOEX|nr:hypothetical protein HF086_003301 [Spodoptera exigua]